MLEQYEVRMPAQVTTMQVRSLHTEKPRFPSLRWSSKG